VHQCLGTPLARMEGQIAVGTFLRPSPEAPLAVASYVLRWRRGCSCADWSDYRSSSRAVTVRSGGNLELDLRRAEAQVMLASEPGGS
jgi:hypothetical protein